MLFVAGALFTACGDSNEINVGYKTTMKVQSVYDAGKVAKGEVINAKFVVENTGDSPLILGSVNGSCSCTVADWTKDPIAPGDKGSITAKVHTENFSIGENTRSITVVSNTVPNTTKIVVKTEIIQ